MKHFILLAIVLLSINSYAKKHNYDPQMAEACENACSLSKNYDEKLIKSQAEARDGDLTRCPVSGVVIKAKKENAVEYKGLKIHTCCSSCSAKFKENPERFAENLN